MSDSKMRIGIPISAAFDSMSARFGALYPGSMHRKTSSNGYLSWRCSSWKSFAISIESFPPEMHTATLSPGFKSSYLTIAFVNFEKRDL